MTEQATQQFKGLTQGDPKVLETLAQMTVGTQERSGLDPQTYMLCRIAALVALDASPVSYLLNLGVAADMDIDADQILGAMVAVAPVVGTARVASAATKMARAGILGSELADWVEGDTDY
jgi:4-carboxymuconolactone decarboxylase